MSRGTRDVRESNRQRIEPRGLSRAEAAAYIGVSPSLFDQMVSDGRMPAPKHVNARRIWDRRELDEAFAQLPNGSDQPADDWVVAL